MTQLINVIPNYEPKLDEVCFEIIDLNIRDLQNKFPNGCICCGNTYLPKRYSSLIAQHFNTKKHKKLCLLPANIDFKNNFGNSLSLKEAFDKMCKENRELKKLNYEYKEELDKLKNSIEILNKINLEYQKKILEGNKIKNIPCTNLIDL